MANLPVNTRPKIGIFGLGRGTNFLKNAINNGFDVVALCDKDREKLERLKAKVPEAALYESFDDFIKHDMDAVILVNYFHEHAQFAIRAMEAGKHVLSEVCAASTMALCVELARAVERTGMKYMLGENYPYMAANVEMKRIYESGVLGRVLYSHGEYIHPSSVESTNQFTRGEYHWRSWTPRTYYLSHSLGPLMFITNSAPKTVTAVSAYAPELCKGTQKHVADGIAAMLCNMGDGSISTFTGAGAIAGRGNWYRIACLDGFAESVRGNDEKMIVAFNEWSKPADRPRVCEYIPNIDKGDVSESIIKDAGHWGGDYWVMYHFKRVLWGLEEPYFDIYRGLTMASVGILGWRSVLEGGKTFEIPDFRTEEARKLYENDTVSPFPKADGSVDIPCCKKEYHPTDEDRATAEAIWKKFGVEGALVALDKAAHEH